MRIPFRKVDEPLELDPTVAELLVWPVPREEQVLKAIRAAGGDEDVAKAAATAARALDALRVAFGGELPPKVREAVYELFPPSDLMGEEGEPDGRSLDLTVEPKPPKVTPPLSRDRVRPAVVPDAADVLRAAEHPEETALARLAKADPAGLFEAIGEALPGWHADRLQKADPTLTRERALARAYEEDPALYERERLRQAERIEKSQRERAQARVEAEAALEREAVRIRKAEPSLTAAQAYVRALDTRRDLVAKLDGPSAGTRIPVDKARADRPADAPELPAALEQAARKIRDGNPKLSHAQAVALALSNDPSLYRKKG